MPTVAPDISLSIGKDVVAGLPIVECPVRIVTVDTLEKADLAAEALMREKVIGFDTETKPSFHKGRTNKVALMQLSTASTCFLFRLNIIGLPMSLCRLLENPDVLKIGLSLHDDFSVIHRSSNLLPGGFVDLQEYVKNFCIKDASLQRIFAILFSQKISKNQRLTNWEAPALTRKQKEYASIDAWACLHIWNYLESGKFDPTQSPFIVTEPEEGSQP